ncbi:MAG TPA: PEP-CTERM sorting domain-containing protein, partial [Candidatus Binatia bacterium]|nr:PEP-CTERM sorting domain-containing protein [Candidatus Binatia bacterium]
MKCRRLFFLLAPFVTALFLFVIAYPISVATAQTTYGTLDNFDVINDTGGETHGFEIELEGISASDVAYTFGAPYQRYGDPTIVTTAAGSVIIRYAASFSGGAWSATTPVAVAPYPPTQGHSCWTGGDPNYLNSGCDHFGASLNATPTKTTYRWLVASGSGTLTPFGSNVPIPAPAWNVTPPAVPGGQPV